MIQEIPTTSHPESNSRPKRILLIIGIALLCLLVAVIFLARFRLSSNALKQRAIQMLEQKFNGSVEMRDLEVSVFPKLLVHGSGITIRYGGRTDVPPLIEIKDFTADAGIFGLLSKPWDIDTVQLTGLVIKVPPRGIRTAPKPRTKHPHKEIPILIHELIADDTVLQLLPRDEGKEPNEFDIHHLHMHYVGLHRAASFVAQLTNPKPPGLIDAKGNFGPWNPEEPSQTPLGASYTFSKADLGVFKGISGILSSTGRFGGVLDHIDVEGVTDTPDFVVNSGGHPLALHTDFSATVDGTNGDTILHPVKARFLNSSLVANGKVFGTVGKKGRTILLDVVVDKSRIEDMLRLAVKADKPLMTGPLRFKTKFILPPGEGDVAQRLQLDGNFAIQGAEFTSEEVSEKLKALSRKAKGKPDEPDAGSSVATLQGHFLLDDRIITLRNTTFAVPGATFAFAGNYTLENEGLDFHGTLRMDAKLSQTMTGFKSFLLRPIDPFFRKGHETQLPIKISGTRSEPSFGLDFHHKDKGKAKDDKDKPAQEAEK